MSFSLKFLHVEESVRPIQVEWLSNTTFLILDSEFKLATYNISLNVFSPTGLNGYLKIISTSLDSRNSVVLGLTPKSIESISANGSNFAISDIGFPGSIASVCGAVFFENKTLLLCSTNAELSLKTDQGGQWEMVKVELFDNVSSIMKLSEYLLLMVNSKGDGALYDLESMRLKCDRKMHSGSIQGVSVLNSGHIATVGRDKSMRVWSLKNDLTLIWSINDLHKHFINCIDSVESEIWTGGSDGKICIASITEQQVVYVISAHRDSVRSIKFSPDGQHAISLSDDGTLKVFDRLKREELDCIGTPRHYFRSAYLLENLVPSSVVIVGTTSGEIKIIDRSSGELIRIQKLTANCLRGVCCISDRVIVSSDDEGGLYFYNQISNSVIESELLGEGITSLCVDEKKSFLVCGFRDGFIRTYSIERIFSLISTVETSKKCRSKAKVNIAECLIAENKLHDHLVGEMQVLDDGMLISCSDDNTIKTSLAESVSYLQTLYVGASAINNLLIDSSKMYFTTDGGKVHILDKSKLLVDFTYSEHSYPVRALAFIINGYFASGDRNGNILIWSSVSEVTVFSKKFKERILFLNFDSTNFELLVVSEGEVVVVDLSQDRDLFDIDVAPTRNASHLANEGDISNSILDSESVSQSEVFFKIRGREFLFSKTEKELITRFVHDYSGALCEIGLIGSGLSGAKVFRVTVFDLNSVVRINAVAKLGTRESIEKEVEAYEREISRLDPSATPRLLSTFVNDEDDLRVVLYSLTNAYDSSFFDVLSQTEDSVSSIVNILASKLSPWVEGQPLQERSVSQLRSSLMSDESYSKVVKKYSLDWTREIESEKILVRESTTHGDLHGENILINDKGDPLLIDYGDVAVRASSVDPITLYFSMQFHVNSPYKDGGWIRPELACKWWTPEYLNECQFSVFSHGCLNWAQNICGSDQEIAAVAYSYLIRQFKYDDTNKDLLRSYLEGAQNYFNH